MDEVRAAERRDADRSADGAGRKKSPGPATKIVVLTLLALFLVWCAIALVSFFHVI